MKKFLLLITLSTMSLAAFADAKYECIDPSSVFFVQDSSFGITDFEVYLDNDLAAYKKFVIGSPDPKNYLRQMQTAVNVAVKTKKKISLSFEVKGSNNKDNVITIAVNEKCK